MLFNQLVFSELYHSSPCGQLMSQECALSNGKLSLGGLLRNSVVGINRCPDIISDSC